VDPSWYYGLNPPVKRLINAYCAVRMRRMVSTAVNMEKKWMNIIGERQKTYQTIAARDLIDALHQT